LAGWLEETFGRRCRRETIRRALHRLELSWKKARKLLGRADPQRREAFIAQVRDLLAGAQHDRHLLVYLDEAHIHQDAGLGYGWSARGQRFRVGSHSPRLADKLSFYGLHLHNEGEVRLWPHARAKAVREAAAALQIGLVPLPGYSPGFMPVEALWRWLREDVTYHHCHRTTEDPSRRVAAFEARLNQDPCVVADRLSVKERLDPEEEKLRFSR
jgi:Winged helix-turn helix